MSGRPARAVEGGHKAPTTAFGFCCRTATGLGLTGAVGPLGPLHASLLAQEPLLTLALLCCRSVNSATTTHARRRVSGGASGAEIEGWVAWERVYGALRGAMQPVWTLRRGLARWRLDWRL